MAESIVQVTEGSGKKLHTWSYTVGANTVEDEVTVVGPQPWPAYTVTSAATSGATAAAHVMQLMAGPSLKVRIVRIKISEFSATLGVVRFDIVRLTTAGTGGTAVTARPYDNTAAAVGAAGMTLPTVKGTEGVTLEVMDVGNIGATSPTNASTAIWAQSPFSQPIIIPAGITNGIALKTTGLAATTYDVVIEFVETAF